MPRRRHALVTDAHDTPGPQARPEPPRFMNRPGVCEGNPTMSTLSLRALPAAALPRVLAGYGLLATLAVVTSACAWSVPADPGRNALLRGHAAGTDADEAPIRTPGGAAPAEVLGGNAPDAGARALYLTKCSQCHEPFSPRHASAAEWPALVRRYGPRAGLFGEDRERVLHYLQANAR